MAEPHTLLYADPVSVAGMKNVGIKSSLEAQAVSMYYPNGRKRHTLRMEIQKKMAANRPAIAESRRVVKRRAGRRRNQLSSTFGDASARSGKTSQKKMGAARRSPALLRSGYNAAIGKSLHYYGVGAHTCVPDEVGAAARYTSDVDGGPGALGRRDREESSRAAQRDALDDTLAIAIADAVAQDDPLMTPLSASFSAIHRPQAILTSTRRSAKRAAARGGGRVSGGASTAPLRLDTDMLTRVAASPFGRKSSWEARQSLSRSSQRSRQAATPKGRAPKGTEEVCRGTGACPGVGQVPPSRHSVDLEAKQLIASLLSSNRRIDRLSQRACAR
jgi:hypothetical protein